MNNKLIVAAAGSGKTTHLVKEALKISKGKVLITTYTDANEKEIIKKFYEINGCIPENITVKTWFSFLIQHGVKPYQSVLYDCEVKGLLLVNAKSGFRYKPKVGNPVYYGEDDVKHYYFSDTGYIYSDKLSKFVVKIDELTDGLIIKRMEKIYTHIFIDEVQDMAGYDLEIMRLLFNSSLNILLVGDPRQVTYHTHDEAKYKKYLNGGIVDFIKSECQKYTVVIDDTSLNITYRNNKGICDFANSIYSEYRPCKCKGHKPTGHDGVFFVSSDDVATYLSLYNPMQLRDSKRTPVNEDYPVKNLGDSKGLTFDRVLIYPTAKMLDWILDNKKELKPQSKAKFYVGVTRAKYSVAIVFNNKKGTVVNGITNFSLEKYDKQL